jgi:hypothetical protein
MRVSFIRSSEVVMICAMMGAPALSYGLVANSPEPTFVQSATNGGREPSLPNAVPQHFSRVESPACCDRPFADRLSARRRYIAAFALRSFMRRAAFLMIDRLSEDEIADPQGSPDILGPVDIQDSSCG